MHKESLLISLGLTAPPKNLDKPLPKPEIPPLPPIKPAPPSKLPPLIKQESINPEYKDCSYCGKTFKRKKGRSWAQWVEAKYCSTACLKSKNYPNATNNPIFRITTKDRAKLEKNILTIMNSGSFNIIGIFNELVRRKQLPHNDGRYMQEYSIYRIVKKIKINHKQPKPVTKAEVILKLVKEGYRTDVIAKRLNCSVPYVHCVMYRNNTTLTKLQSCSKV